MLKRILVPVDFSSHTGISCHYARAIAETTGAEIILFHSFFDQLYYSGAGFNSGGFESGIMLTDEIILDFQKQKESRLQELAGELKSSLSGPGKSNVNVACHMGIGDPEVQILQAIEEFVPDLIILGSGGMGKKRLLSGSVARRIMNTVNIPVMAIPDMDQAAPIRNVVYMTTFEPSDKDIIVRIDSLLKNFQVNFFCLHLSDENDSAISKQKMNDFAGSQMPETLQGRISFHVLDDENQEEALRIFLEEQKTDLVSFIPHKRNILKTIVFQGLTKEDLFLTRIPILAVKPVS
jgi:nucleotide-binding universal stress UspA family protein